MEEKELYLRIHHKDPMKNAVVESNCDDSEMKALLCSLLSSDAHMLVVILSCLAAVVANRRDKELFKDIFCKSVDEAVRMLQKYNDDRKMLN